MYIYIYIYLYIYLTFKKIRIVMIHFVLFKKNVLRVYIYKVYIYIYIQYIATY